MNSCTYKWRREHSTIVSLHIISVTIDTNNGLLISQRWKKGSWNFHHKKINVWADKYVLSYLNITQCLHIEILRGASLIYTILNFKISFEMSFKLVRLDLPLEKKEK